MRFARHQADLPARWNPVWTALIANIAAWALIILMLASCAVARDPTRVDFLGNVYPPQCADLSDINIPIIEVRNVLYAPGESAFGEWLPREPVNVILVLKGLHPWLREEAIRHEKCHEKMFRLTGSPAWHPSR